MLDLGMGGSRDNDHFIVSDLTNRPVNPVFNARPPRNITNQIVWLRQNFAQTLTTNTTTTTETNFYWTAVNYMLQYTNWLALFDEYCCHSVVITIQNPNTNAAVASLPEVFTAIDYDNSTTLGSQAAITAYSTCNAAVLGPGESVTRFVMPCQTTFVSPSTSLGVTRCWVDSAYNGAAFYGVRTFIQNTPGAAIVLDVSFSIIWAFRNTI